MTTTWTQKMGEASLAAELAGTYMTQVPEQAGARKFETRMALARAARSTTSRDGTELGGYLPAVLTSGG